MKKLYGKAVAILLVAVMMITSTKWDVLYASAEDQTDTAMDEVAKQFDAYYLADASVDSTMVLKNVNDRWTMNDKGFVAAKKDSTGDETKNVDVLTFNRRGILMKLPCGYSPQGSVGIICFAFSFVCRLRYL